MDIVGIGVAAKCGRAPGAEIVGVGWFIVMVNGDFNGIIVGEHVENDRVISNNNRRKIISRIKGGVVGNIIVKNSIDSIVSGTNREIVIGKEKLGGSSAGASVTESSSLELASASVVGPALLADASSAGSG